jgi:hypothetical protein
MKTLSGITDGLLDFETSITKELELGAMLGKNINLNRARALAYEGDIEGATKETLKALGGVDAFNRMDYFQKKQTADLLGTSVAELEKMAKYQEQANTLGGKLNIAFDSVTESVKALGNSFGGKVLKGAGSLLMTASQAGAQFSQMGFDVKGLLTKLPGVNKLLGGAAAGSGIPFASAANQMTPPTMGPMPNPAGDSTSKLTESVSKIKMNDVVKGAAAMVLIAGSLFILGKALQEFSNVGLNEIGMAVLGIGTLTAAMFGLGLLFSGPQAGFILIAAQGMFLIGAAVAALGFGINQLASGFKTFGEIAPILSGLVSMVGGIFMLSAAFTALAGSLGLLGIMGIAALPTLLGLGVAGAGLGMLFGAFSGGESEETSAVEGGSLSEYNTQMLSKMDELIQVTKAAKDVYLDREKVTGLVISTSEKNSVNKFSLNNA